MKTKVSQGHAGSLQRNTLYNENGKSYPNEQRPWPHSAQKTTKRATSRCNGMKWLVATARSNEKLPPLQRTPSRCNEQPVVATTRWPLQRVVATSANEQRVVATSLCNDSLPLQRPVFQKGKRATKTDTPNGSPVRSVFATAVWSKIRLADLWKTDVT